MIKNIPRSLFFLCLLGLFNVFSAVAFAAIAETVKHNGIAYFSSVDSNVITRYSLTSESFLPPITLSDIPSAIHVSDAGMFVSYGLTVARRNLDGSNETTVFTSSKSVDGLTSYENILVLGSTDFVQTIDISSSNLIDSHSYPGLSAKVSIDLKNNRIVARNFSSEMRSIPIESDGMLGSDYVSENISNSSLNNKFVIFPSQNRAINTRGYVFNTLDASYVDQIGSFIKDFVIWQDFPISLNISTDGSNIDFLNVYDKALRIHSRYDLTNIAQVIHIYNDKIFAFSDDLSTVEIINTSDLTVPDVTAPIDPQGLEFFPDTTQMDSDNDTLYLLSKKHLSIFRWSVSQQRYLESIALQYSPRFMSYSSEQNRIYLAYGDNSIHYVDLSDFSINDFYHAPQYIASILAIGNYLVTNDASLNRDGQVVSEFFHLGSVAKLNWDGVNSRIYYHSSGVTPFSVYWYQFNPQTGEFGPDADFKTYYSLPSPGYIIRGSESGKHIAYNSGLIAYTSDFNNAATLTDSNLRDLQWLYGNLFTIKQTSFDGGVEIKRWKADFTLLQGSENQMEGIPVALLRAGNSLVLVRVVNNIPAIEQITADPIDTDGDGVLDHLDIFPADPLDWADADNDGIGDNADPDDDNDGYSDIEDAFPLDSTEWLDTDGDGTGNNADTDDDDDGVLDVDDYYPTDASRTVIDPLIESYNLLNVDYNAADNIAYMFVYLYAEPRDGIHYYLFQYSVSSQSFLQSLPLSDHPDFPRFSDSLARFYLHYPQSPEIRYIDTNNLSEHTLTTIDGNIEIIRPMGNFVFVYGTFNNTANNILIINAGGEIVDQGSTTTSIDEVMWNPHIDTFYYGVRHVVSPSYFYWQELDPLTGQLSNVQSIAHEGLAGSFKNKILSSNGRLLLSGGSIYDVYTGQRVAPAPLDNVKTWYLGNIFTATNTTDNPPVIKRYKPDGSEDLADRRELEGMVTHLLATRDSLLVFKYNPRYEIVALNYQHKDFDNDGVLDGDDHYPTNSNESWSAPSTPTPSDASNAPDNPAASTNNSGGGGGGSLGFMILLLMFLTIARAPIQFNYNP